MSPRWGLPGRCPVGACLGRCPVGAYLGLSCGFINVAPLGLTWGGAPGFINLAPLGLLPGAVPLALLISPRWGLLGEVPLEFLFLKKFVPILSLSRVAKIQRCKAEFCGFSFADFQVAKLYPPYIIFDHSKMKTDH